MIIINVALVFPVLDLPFDYFRSQEVYEFESFQGTQPCFMLEEDPFSMPSIDLRIRTLTEKKINHADRHKIIDILVYDLYFVHQQRLSIPTSRNLLNVLRRIYSRLYVPAQMDHVVQNYNQLTLNTSSSNTYLINYDRYSTAGRTWGSDYWTTTF